jgi:hypothetical protein
LTHHEILGGLSAAFQLYCYIPYFIGIFRGDCIFFALGIFTIPLWLITKTPIWSVTIAALINGLAFLPTLRKSWHRPYDEAAQTFFIGGVASTLGIIAQQHRTFSTVLYPGWTGLSDFIFVVVLILRRKATKKESHDLP